MSVPSSFSSLSSALGSSYGSSSGSTSTSGSSSTKSSCSSGGRRFRRSRRSRRFRRSRGYRGGAEGECVKNEDGTFRKWVEGDGEGMMCPADFKDGGRRSRRSRRFRRSRGYRGGAEGECVKNEDGTFRKWVEGDGEGMPCPEDFKDGGRRSRRFRRSRRSRRR